MRRVVARLPMVQVGKAVKRRRESASCFERELSQFTHHSHAYLKNDATKRNDYITSLLLTLSLLRNYKTLSFV